LSNIVCDRVKNLAERYGCRRIARSSSPLNKLQQSRANRQKRGRSRQTSTSLRRSSRKAGSCWKIQRRIPSARALLTCWHRLGGGNGALSSHRRESARQSCSRKSLKQFA